MSLLNSAQLYTSSEQPSDEVLLRSAKFSEQVPLISSDKTSLAFHYPLYSVLFNWQAGQISIRFAKSPTKIGEKIF
jgi:hypothetical protein